MEKGLLVYLYYLHGNQRDFKDALKLISSARDISNDPRDWWHRTVLHNYS